MFTVHFTVNCALWCSLLTVVLTVYGSVTCSLLTVVYSSTLQRPQASEGRPGISVASWTQENTWNKSEKLRGEGGGQEGGRAEYLIVYLYSQIVLIITK